MKKISWEMEPALKKVKGDKEYECLCAVDSKSNPDSKLWTWLAQFSQGIDTDKSGSVSGNGGSS